MKGSCMSIKRNRNCDEIFIYGVNIMGFNMFFL